MKPTFAIGDRITLRDGLKAEILAIRHEIGNSRSGTLCVGADVLRQDGKVHFYFFHDIARWNAARVAESFS